MWLVLASHSIFDSISLLEIGSAFSDGSNLLYISALAISFRNFFILFSEKFSVVIYFVLS